MRATYPTNLILLEMTALITFEKSKRYEAHHYAAFSNLPPLPAS